ncbi:hypothetical protein ACTKQT_002551 [Listeria monocytogenes]|uniref:hypothetical protein n=1 Tax=Listeria marthii TaxID=529731 RepID=UPI00188704EF|nr:hypothetical protein [Listeria marthii]MBF2512824.1 hypothetical protein [Listeria marthii]
MESYIQITNEAAVKMILNGDYNELWFEKDGDIVTCEDRLLDVHALPKFKFFVRLSDEK